jgi:GT2 family glycosyltransferase
MMLAHMERCPSVGMLGPKILNADGTLQPSVMGFPTVWNTFCRALALDAVFPRSKLFGGRLMAFWHHDAILRAEVLNGCFWTVRREALERVGLLDEDFFIYGEDIDWCKRFHDGGWDVVFFPDARAIHYGGSSSSNAPTRFYVEMQKADLQYWRKHHSWPAWKLYAAISWLHEVLRVVGQSAVYVFVPSRRARVLPKMKRSVACMQWLLRNFFHVRKTQLS